MALPLQAIYATVAKKLNEGYENISEVTGEHFARYDIEATMTLPTTTNLYFVEVENTSGGALNVDYASLAAATGSGVWTYYIAGDADGRYSLADGYKCRFIRSYIKDASDSNLFKSVWMRSPPVAV